MTDPAAPASPSNKPPCLREDALAVLVRLREAGHVAYFAGGCVRDELMGLEPKDYDIATDAPPQRVRELFSSTQAVGAAFGVILVRHRRSIVEVATFRTDVSYEDGRRPTAVRFTTAEEDAKRRDFTINGLFLDPVENRVIDYVGGQQDIHSRILRAIGNPDERFAEDHLRLLRAVRFAARFQLAIDPATSQAIGRHAPQLARISPERIAEELRLMFAIPEQGAAWAWHALRCEYPGLSNVIFRFLGSPPDDETRASFAGLFAGFPVQDPWPFGLSLASISLEWVMMQNRTSDVVPLVQRSSVQRITRALRQALRISNEEGDQVTGTLEGIGMLLRDANPTTAVLKRFLARKTAPLSRRLLDRLACHIGVEPVRRLNAALDGLAQSDFAPPPLLTGDDLVARGLTPGPAFKRALDFVYDEQLEDRVRTREEAIELGVKKVREFEAERHAR
jgi:poly(A) polymerase